MRVLVVVSEAGLSAFLARAFSAEGFQVDVAADAQQGLARALGGSFDLVLLDLALPGAFDLLRRIQERRAHLPVLVLSDRGELDTKLQAFEFGAVDYVVKPFSLEELIARCRVQLRRTHPLESGSVLRVGRLALDVARRQARLGTTTVDLPDREFRVLHYLMLHRGEIVSRQRLLSEVWGYNFDPRSNVVDVCVRRLRRLLGPDAPIETVRNAGYRAAVPDEAPKRVLTALTNH